MEIKDEFALVGSTKLDCGAVRDKQGGGGIMRFFIKGNAGIFQKVFT